MQTAIRVEERTLLNGTGSEEQCRIKTVEALSCLLADTYLLSLKTHGFHWNITGPMFLGLHGLFEDQYTELWSAADEIAERIRALGFPAPSSYREFSKLAYIHEAERVPDAKDMVEQLVRDHETVARTARWSLTLAKAAVDPPTEDLLTRRLAAHEKAIWMLKSALTEERADGIAQDTGATEIREAVSRELKTSRKWCAPRPVIW